MYKSLQRSKKLQHKIIGYFLNRPNLMSAFVFKNSSLNTFSFQHQERFKSGLLAKTSFEMEQALIILTGFYVHPFNSFEFGDERLTKLHQILSNMYNTSDYPSSEILQKLAPDCKDIILRGLIFGKPVNPNNFIIKNLTSLSVCCMFNYQRRRSYLFDE